MKVFPDVQIGAPIRCGAVSVFPLFLDGNGNAVTYQLSHEVLPSGEVTVEETSESGTVPFLNVENKTVSPVLFVEGEELEGAKQNRVMNLTVMVGAESKVQIPVSCVEQGRWQYRTRHFSSSGSHGSPKLRYILKESVSRSTREGRGKSSDQMKVWGEIARQSSSLGSESPTGAMSQAYEDYRKRIQEAQEALQYVQNAVGLALAVGDKVRSVDVFDQPATCEKLWSRLLTGAAIEAFETGGAEPSIAITDVETVLGTVNDLEWQEAPAAGLGKEIRTEVADGTQATGLVVDDVLVHGSVVSP